MTTQAPPKHEMAVMSPVEGDTKIIWEPENEHEVKNARETFDELKGKGFLAYRVKKDGESGEILREFDKHAEKMILTPPLVGG